MDALTIDKTVEIDMLGYEIKGTVTFSDSIGKGALNSTCPLIAKHRTK